MNEEKPNTLTFELLREAYNKLKENELYYLKHQDEIRRQAIESYVKIHRLSCLNSECIICNGE